MGRLEKMPLVRAAALVANTFNLDPVLVLAETDALRRDVRLAAHNVVQSEVKKASKRAPK